jgi:threonine dehydrogenase-like Zn-dependent dehydrogenase
MYGAGDVRVENVADAHLVEPTDALVRVTRAAICGSDLWPYKSMESTDAGRRMGHEFIGIVEGVGSEVRTRPAISSSRHSFGPTARASSAARACRASACTAAGSASTMSTAARAKPCASLRPTARSSSCQSERTTS